ncbi:Crp/Fnr family transcriptional regulator [Paenibacillus soyae]|uniref:Crp/Fnr family transcriptional regulator n=1 Tax=Paenibacillus soyae TaxID=2969249 RepID=A0A9X2MT27_9BACL|nr:Crp/Fnr family transcriptional regulator [Paenibacillus soyae]MCR2805291.1 Crp/Fnr family transcriptional regulator [Paenibacillus soyae]
MLLHKGEVLFRQGEIGGLFTVKRGLLKIMRVNEDGNPFLVNIIVEGETIPHHSLLSPAPNHGTAIALVTCEIERIDPGPWYASLHDDPAKNREIALLLQGKLRMMQQRIDQLTQVAPADKLRKLEEWFRQYIGPDQITGILTQEEIGQLIGLRRETVNRLLRSGAANGES